MADLAFSAQEEATLEATIFGERVYVLYTNALLGQAVNLAIAFAIAVLAWGKVDPVPVLAWTGAVLVIAMCRVLLALAFKRAEPGPDTIRKWHWRFFAGVIATGLQWAAAAVLFFIPGDPPAQTVLLIIFAGLAAGAVPVLAADKKIYFVYCLLTLLPLGAMMSIQNDLGMHVVATLDVVFMIAMLTVAHRFHEALTNALRLGFEKEALARQISEERDRTESVNVDLQHELTAQRRAKAGLLKAKEAAEAAATMQGRVLANMSNELREPLHGIISLANLALTESLSRNVRADVTKILSLARSVSGTLTGILDISDIESGTLAIERMRIRLPEVLENVFAIYGTLAEDKGLSLSVYADPGLPRHVIGDAVRIGQILNDFVGNAIKLTERGSITVDARVLSRADNKVHVSFSVRDTGIGLTPQQSRSAFQTESPAGAAGGFDRAAKLGLTLCKQLANAMGGRIGVESELGTGSRFWVELPFEVVEDGAAAPADAGEEGPDLQGMTVLVVDNDRVTQLVVRTLLERRGVNVLVAHDGREALNIAFDKVTPLDAVLIDLAAPAVDGKAFAGSVRKKIPATTLPVFVIADESHPLSPEECGRLGMNGCLTRPLAPGDLFEAVYGVARQRQAGPGSEPPSDSNQPEQP